MKIAFIHPLKHHIYFSMAGALQTENEVVGLFGYYTKDDIVDRVILRTKFHDLAEGYHYDKIDRYVKVSIWIKILFLLYKCSPRFFERFYMLIFQWWCILNLKDVDCIHVLQDYCNIVIRYAKKHHIKIVYEQILAYDVNQFIAEPSDIEHDKKLSNQKENLIAADKVLMASHFVKKSILNRINSKDLERKIQVIPYGASIADFNYHTRTYQKGKKLSLLIVANISKRKGTDYLIKAMEGLQGKAVQLNMIGAPDTGGEILLDKIKHVSNINYYGKIPHAEIHKFFNQSDVFVLPSLAEGSSLSVYEAIAAGMPCIVTENVGSVIEDKKDGLIIEAKSSKAIIDAILYFLDNPDEVERMSVNTQKTIKEFSWNEFEKKIGDFYRKIEYEWTGGKNNVS
ncbi:MAG: glycosyltransferase family 4 protein [Lachnospiraceae bacterium]|nr:glycosyltransferase family 4 protein [Lachnospiraceae bacterium]